jgi:SAM-dependent methyltransferase
VLDAGCGGGRYARLAGRHGARVIGVDLSAAVEKAAALCAGWPDVTIVQADLLDLPLAEAAFDVAFSIGVLHHSPDPRRAFAQVAARVKPGGRLAVWLYRKNTPPQEALNTALRAVTTRLPARVLEPVCAGLGVLGGIPVLNKTLNKVVNFSNHPDWTLRVCDSFDWYAPRYQSHHTTAELERWFSEEGFEDLTVLPPARSGRLYDWAYRHDLILGSGVNVAGTKKSS